MSGYGKKGGLPDEDHVKMVAERVAQDFFLCELYNAALHAPLTPGAHNLTF